MTPAPARTLLWCLAIATAVGVRAWNAFEGPLLWGYDAWGHVAYVLFLDLHRAVPFADQGWSYFHPPLHYALGWILAQFGSAEVLMRGLAVLGSLASLATAALCAHAVRRFVPERPGAPLLAFAAVALLPVHLYVSAMPGNELTVTLLATASVVVFAANQARARPSLAQDAGVGLLVGLALLAKFSGLLAGLAVLGALLLGNVGGRERWARVGLRALAVLAAAAAVAAPHYARNVHAFGTPFKLSRDYPLVASVERTQPPGERRLGDYLSVSPLALWDPDPRAPHLLHAIWPSAYVGVWADVHRESDVAPTPAARAADRRIARGMVLLGLAPTLLALAGVALALRDAWRGRARALLLPVLLLGATTLGAYAVFAWRVPTVGALKASYLLGLSLPYAVGLVRGVESLSPPRLRVLAVSLVGVACAASAFTGVEGAAWPRRADAPASGAAYYYFGEYARARAVYGRLAAGAGYPVPWLDNLAAVALAERDGAVARRFTARAQVLAGAAGREDPQRAVRLAVADAIAGDLEGAQRGLDTLAPAAPLPEALANRGAIAVSRGRLAAAERELRAALAADPALTPAWENLAVLGAARGDAELERASRRAARESACRAPRGYPHGIGTGEILEWGIGRRPLLRVSGVELSVWLPADWRRACARLRAAAGETGE